MTALKSLGLNLVMLAVASGFLFWVLQEGPDSLPEQPGTARQGQGQGMTSPVLQTPLASSDQSESEGESQGGGRLAPNQAPAPALSSPATPARRPVTFPLDLNTAKLEDFIELPGIGEKLAQRLVDYRQSHGGFRSVEDLREVRGIGAKRFERLRPLVVTAVAP